MFLEIGRSSLCGGALISNQHVITMIILVMRIIIILKVLTAAHCVDDGTTASDLRVYVGTHDIADPAKIVDVSIININPSWTGSVYTGSDSAVLTLAESVPFSDTVRPLCMSVDPSRSSFNSMHYTDKPRNKYAAIRLAA